MRIWSLHPKYLDTQGLTACWRETLLAQKVLQGDTKGYRNHPQLLRFKATNDPLAYVSSYLHGLVNEAERRGFKYDRSKIVAPDDVTLQLPVARGQLEFEWQHLKNKLKARSKNQYDNLCEIEDYEAHPLFYVISGPIETWERP